MNQWVRCTQYGSYERPETYLINLAHVALMRRTDEATRVVFSSSDLELEVRDPPDNILAQVFNPLNEVGG